MPQRGYKTEAINWDRYFVIDQPPTEQRVLERVGFTKGKWDEVDWFVRFARMDLAKASPGDFLSLQEEFAALVTAHFKNSPDTMPNREQILEIQQTIRKHLTELVDEGRTMFQALPGNLWILFPRMAAKLPTGLWAGATKEQISGMPDIVSHRVASGDPANLVPLLGELLEKVGRPIIRCPHCQHIFLQSRTNQEYCGRSCQSVAVMQERRAVAKTKSQRKINAKKPSPKSSAKERSRPDKNKRAR